ncbi:MAG: ABC transporter ATP-binding protein/permease [Alphaproteobacteria bacterium]|nr:ABC transporter ATP-binding protein/permease [Alphaproteobacteria bacterium]
MKKKTKQVKQQQPDILDGKIKLSLYGRVWREVGRPQLKWLALGIGATIIAAAAEAFSITLVKQIIDEGFIAQNMKILYFLGLQIVFAFTAKSAFSYARSLLLGKAGLMAATELRMRIYRHMMKMHIGVFHDSRSGKLLNYFGALAGSVLNLVTDTVITTVQHVATLLFMMILMLWYAPQMVVILLFMVPAIILPLLWIMKKKRKLTRLGFGIGADSLSHVTQSIQGVKTIQSFAMECTECDTYCGIEIAGRRNAYKQMQISGLQSPLLEIMISVGICLSLILGGHFITSGVISTGDFAAFILALTAAYQPAKKVTGVGNGVQAGLIAAEQLFEFLDSKSEVVDAKDAVPMTRGPVHVKLENVSFAYEVADGEVLRDVSLDVEPGAVCALVGPSGGGKSTIFNLLERFYDPQSGRVVFNGRDLKKYTIESVRKNIAIVSQDVFLFHGSILDNIKYGVPDATEKQIHAAAVAANAHEFIKDLPNGYDTNVGERGANLSGGQKQRIAIARAILKDASILLLDEATSALDSQSEKLIQSALANLMKGRTTFVIAHRLSTILDADQILVVKEGRIVERGTDKQLCASDGVYKKLRDVQLRE